MDGWSVGSSGGGGGGGGGRVARPLKEEDLLFK